MKTTFLFCYCLWIAVGCVAAGAPPYQPLDASDPVLFKGDSFFYRGKAIVPDKKNFFVDGSLPDEVATRYPYVFNSVNQALAEATDGTPENPMTLYIAPYVYWIDDPDDPTLRTASTGNLPFGLEVECNGLRLCGLTQHPENVVLAGNRGQTHGAIGNFTLFHFTGDDLRVENLTMGNYCNVDLEYPLLPQLNRKRRASAIVQGQLAICRGDRISAWNCRFISRLNTCPLVGGKRTFFKDCHFECTDDALCGTGVHQDCSFIFFSSKPFYTTQPTGAVLLNCDIEVRTQGKQFLTKVPNPVTLVDCRFTHETDSLVIGWNQAPPPTLRCYQYNVTLNGKPYRLQPDLPETTVDMVGKPVLKAYRIDYRGEVIYNTYNLLRGEDDWDPMDVQVVVTEIGRENGRNYTRIPIFLGIDPQQLEMEEKRDGAALAATQQRFSGYPLSGSPVNWQAGQPGIVRLTGERAGTCHVIPLTPGEFPAAALLTATTADGLEAGCPVVVVPERLPPPTFSRSPRITSPENGTVTVNYRLETGERPDESLIEWYRCENGSGSNPRKVAVSRLNEPLTTYRLTEGDEGHYLMATVAPKHRRSEAGNPVSVVTSSPVRKEEIRDRNLFTDFKNFPTAYQPEIVPGYWTVDCYKPLDTYSFEWEALPVESWYYGKAADGAKGTGLVQQVRGARLLYTPISNDGKEMRVTLNVDPCKTAGQGFGSATGQYMDIYINFDTATLSGYGLRIVRTPKHDRAVDFILMRYEEGRSTEISTPVSSNCYHTDCTITLETKEGRLTATARTTTPRPVPENQEIVTEVFLSAPIAATGYDGMGIQHTGSVGGNATLLHTLEVEWNKK